MGTFLDFHVTIVQRSGALGSLARLLQENEECPHFRHAYPDTRRNLVSPVRAARPAASAASHAGRDEFVDKADDAARKRFAPEICGLRGENFTLSVSFQGHEERYPPSKFEMNRKLFCKEAGKFSRLRQYKLERKSMDIDLADRPQTATRDAEYVETMPYYEPDICPRLPMISANGRSSNLAMSPSSASRVATSYSSAPRAIRFRRSSPRAK